MYSTTNVLSALTLGKGVGEGGGGRGWGKGVGEGGGGRGRGLRNPSCKQVILNLSIGRLF